MSYEVYMHGQVLGTHIFKLKGEFVQPDSYAEIAEETGKTLKSIDNALQRIKKKISLLLTE